MRLMHYGAHSNQRIVEIHGPAARQEMEVIHMYKGIECKLYPNQKTSRTDTNDLWSHTIHLESNVRYVKRTISK